MENNCNPRFLYDLFQKKANTSASALSYFIENDNKVDDLMQYLTLKPSIENINKILQPLIDNFTLVRMNAARFTKASSKDIFKILFDLYLSFDEGIPPPECILNFFLILLRCGSNENTNFKWLFDGLSIKIRENRLTSHQLLNYLNITKYLYKYNSSLKDNSDFSEKNKNNTISALSSYFYFYPGSGNIKLDLSKNSEINFSKGIGISLWFKFPFQENNIQYFNEESLYNLEIDLCKIEFYNHTPFILTMGFIKGDYKTSLILLQALNKKEQLQLLQNDCLMHLYFAINIKDKRLELYLNGNLAISLNTPNFNMIQITSIELFNNFVGEVQSIVMCSLNPDNYNSNTEIGKIASFSKFYQKLINPIDGKYPNSIALAYFPYAQGENIWNFYNNNSYYTFKFSRGLSGIYNHFSSRVQLNKLFNSNTFLPIFEYIYKHRYDQDYKNEFEEILIQLLEIICYSSTKQEAIASNDIKDTNFFFLLSMFIEKMPNELFTFSLGDKMVRFSAFLQLNSYNNYDQYIKYILLNDKIMYKFPSSFAMWKEITAITLADNNILKLCNVRQLVKALLYYDKNRFTQTCCDKHRDAFSNDSKFNMVIMDPILKDKINDVLELLGKILKVNSGNNVINSNTQNAKDILAEYQLHLCNLFYLNLSPCLQIQLLSLLSKCPNNYDFLKKCLITMNSPFLDVKNACLKFIICCIDTSNTLNNSFYVNIGQLINNYFLTCLNENKADKEISFRQEYNDSCLNDTLQILLKWIVDTNSDNDNKIISESENKLTQEQKNNKKIDVKSKIINADENNSSEVNNLKDLLIELQSIMKKLNIYGSFFEELINLVTDKIQSANINEQANLRSMMEQNILQTKCQIIYCYLQNNCPYQLFYLKIIFLYYQLILNRENYISIREQLIDIETIFLSSIIEDKDKYLDNKKTFDKKKDNNNLQDNQRVAFVDLLIEKTINYLKEKNNQSQLDILHNDLIKIISAAFNYYILNFKPKEDKRDNIYGFFNLSGINNEVAFVFFEDVFSYYQPIWDKNLYNITQLITSIIKSNRQKFSLNGLQFIDTLTNELEIFLQTEGSTPYAFPLIMIICFIFIYKIDKEKSENKEQLIFKFKRYLIFVLLLSVCNDKLTYKIKETKIEKNSSYLYVVLIAGIEFILGKVKENKGLKIQDEPYEILYCIYYFYELYNGNFNIIGSLLNKIQLNTNNSKSAFVEIITIMKENKNKNVYNEGLLKIKSNKGKCDPKDGVFPYLFKLLLNDSLKNYLKSNTNIIKEFVSKGIGPPSNKLIITMQNDPEIQKLKLEYISRYQREELNDLRNSYRTERLKRLKYKQVKKDMCIWNRPWSTHELFYKEKILIQTSDDVQLKFDPKLKMLNHYTKSFTRPFLIPIIDISYYLPKFSQFEQDILFNQEDLLSSDSNLLDINKILDENKQNDNQESLIEEKEIMTPLYYLYNIHKEPDLFYNFEKSIKDDETSTQPSKETCEKLIQKRENEKNKCCLVKVSRHIKGQFKLNQDNFEFITFIIFDLYSNNEEDSCDIDFDNSKGTCFGSYIKNTPKDSNRVNICIPYNSISYIFQKKYLYRDTGIEIFLSNNKSYYFNFLNEISSKNVYQRLKSHLKDQGNAFDYDNTTHLSFNLWRSSKISNLHFLELLNREANRSYDDISQYPVFPWVISNYTIETINDEEQCYRDLSLPMGMIDNERYPNSKTRKEKYIENYDLMVDDEKTGVNTSQPYFFGSHYSSPMYVTQFLSRVFPMGETLIELQGKRFDDPNRLFFSIELCFETVCTRNGDLRELIPQFYYLPEFLLNVNNFNMGTLATGKNVNHVECPAWSERNPFNFVLQMRKFLEDHNVTTNLHKWVDLIFGFKQQGIEAIKSSNLFMKNTYINQIVIKETDTKDNQEYLFRLAEFGLTPKQILTSPCEQKKNKSDNLKFQEGIISPKVKSNVKSLSFRYYSDSNSLKKLSTIKFISDDIINLFYSNGIIEKIKLNSITNTADIINKLEKYGHKLLNSDFKHDIPPLSNKMEIHYETGMLPIIVLDDGSTVFQGGFYDGSMIMSFNKTVSQIKLPNGIFKSPICQLIANKEENIIVAGTTSGLIHIFNRNGKKSNISFVRTLNDHYASISHLFISNELNVLASSSNDNYVHIYTLPNYKMIRSFYVEQCEQVFLSDSPLPSIAIYSSNKTQFLCYSLNGFLLKYVKEEEKPLYPRVIKNSSFFDYLIYVTEKNSIIIRSFPYLERIFIMVFSQNELGTCLYDITPDIKSVIVYTKKNIYQLLLKDLIYE